MTQTQRKPMVRRNQNDIKAELSDISLELEALAKSDSASIEELRVTG
jgi:hypothetical protein